MVEAMRNRENNDFFSIKIFSTSLFALPFRNEYILTRNQSLMLKYYDYRMCKRNIILNIDWLPIPHKTEDMNC